MTVNVKYITVTVKDAKVAMCDGSSMFMYDIWELPVTVINSEWKIFKVTVNDVKVKIIDFSCSDTMWQWNFLVTMTVTYQSYCYICQSYKMKDVKETVKDVSGICMYDRYKSIGDGKRCQKKVKDTKV